MNKPYRLLDNAIVDKEKGTLNNTFKRYIGPGDSLFSMFLRSMGYRDLPSLDMPDFSEYEFIVYDKNPANLIMFKHMLQWDGLSNLDDEFQGFIDHYTTGLIKSKTRANQFVTNSTLGRIQRYGFKDFLHMWDIFRKSKFTYVNLDIIKNNQQFCELLYRLKPIDLHTKQFVKLDINRKDYGTEQYNDAINNTLHILWMRSLKEYQTVVEISDENNVPYEDFAGKIYSKLNPTFCVLPWMHIQYKPSGQSKLCCRYDTVHEYKEYEKDKNMGNLSELVPQRLNLSIQKTTMEDSFKSDYWDTARELTEKNKPISGCYKCYKEEQVAGEVATSMRLGSSILYNSGYLHKKPAFEKPVIEFLEVGFGNYCNLACLTCNSTLSTTWHTDELKLNELTSGPLKRTVFPKLDNLKFNPSEETLKTLKLIKFTGGEPMINPEFIKFIDLICQKGFPENVSLEIYTNCSYVPSPKLLENLKKFKSIQLNLSIDAYGSANDYIRYGSVWHGEGKQTVSNSLDFWLKQGLENKNIYIIMATTMSVLNIFDIPKLVTWWMDTYKNAGFTIAQRASSLPSEVEGFYKLQLAFEPAYISIDILPREYYSAVEQWIEEYEETFTTKYPDLDFIPQSINATLNKLKNAIQRSKGSVANAKLFVEYLDKMDKVRGNSAKQSIPVILDKVTEYLLTQDKPQQS